MKFLCFLLGAIFGIAVLLATVCFLEDDTEYERPKYRVFSNEELRTHFDLFRERK